MQELVAERIERAHGISAQPRVPADNPVSLDPQRT
jgi:hypothetical protein